MLKGYRDSLEKAIPGNWEIGILSDVSEIIFSNVDKITSLDETPVLLCNYLDVYNNEYIDDRIEFMPATATEREIEKFTLKKGDVIITKDSETPDDIAKPAVIVKDLTNVLCGYHLALIRPDSQKVDCVFLGKMLSSKMINHQFERLAQGLTRFGLDVSSIEKALIIVPPLPGQCKIAEILSTVDETIEKTDAIIQETQQLKKGLMQKLFTEGIGHTRFKETKIGRIPEEWEVVNLSNVFQVIDGDRGVNYPKSNEMFDDGYCVFLNAKNVTKSGFKFNEVQFITLEKDEILGKGKLTRGDLVLTTRGTLGNFAYFNDEVTFENLRINSGMVVLRPLNNILTNYYYEYFNSYLMQNQIERLSFGTAQSQLTVGGIQKFRLLVPPNDEQRQIAQILSQVDSKIQTEQAFKEELEKLKNGLMQVLLTGKVRVKV